MLLEGVPVGVRVPCLNLSGSNTSRKFTAAAFGSSVYLQELGLLLSLHLCRRVGTELLPAVAFDQS